MLTEIDMRWEPHDNPTWWRNAILKAGSSPTSLRPEETDPIDAMRRIAKAEAESARKKLASILILTYPQQLYYPPKSWQKQA